MPSRRGFLAAAAAALALPRAGWADAGAPSYLAAAKQPDGSMALYGLRADGAVAFHLPLPARGHAAAGHPTAPEAVVFARRPGRFALVVDCAAGRVRATLDAPEGRHFYGHGAFIAGGDILCTTENAFDTGDGVIGLWSRSDGWRRIGEVPSGGIGPHEILSLPGDVLAVANGGIRTHPDIGEGREAIDPDAMRPNLTYLDADGRVLDVVELDPALRPNSIRHLAHAEGTVAFAMQWQGDPYDAVPLLGLHRRGAPPVLADPGPVEALAMKGYAGSVAADGQGARFAVTSPRGGRLQVFDRSGALVAAEDQADVCGIAPSATGFVATDGTGGVRLWGDGPARTVAHHVCNWDNHLVALPV